MNQNLKKQENQKVAIILKTFRSDIRIRKHDFVSIQNVVENYYVIDSIHKNTRKREIVQARQICMWIARSFNVNEISLSEIGKFFGNKDHATVLHSCKNVLNLIETDKTIENDVCEILKKLIYEITITKVEVEDSIRNGIIKLLSIKINKVNELNEKFNELKTYICN